MSEPFLGEIKMFGGNFAPQGYATCDGQLMSISQNTALFSLLGTTYGGNGVQTFALPDLRGRVPMHAGNGPGLTPRILGESGGTENVTLTTAEMPIHSHGLLGHTGPGDKNTIAGNCLSDDGGNQSATYSSAQPVNPMNANSITASGGNLPHTNMQPYLCVNFIIALQGVYPARS
jgi:microcystin-dependent protein